jgi:hypothetical protein
VDGSGDDRALATDDGPPAFVIAPGARFVGRCEPSRGTLAWLDGDGLALNRVFPQARAMPNRGAAQAGSALSFDLTRRVALDSKSLTALAVAATAGVATLALFALLRSGNRTRARVGERIDLERWDGEGGNIPEVSITGGEQGSMALPDRTTKAGDPGR